MATVRAAFFFRGGKYVRYDIDPTTGAETVNHGIYPREVSDGWGAMPADFTHGIDAVVNWPDGFVYFFKGPRYVRWDATNDTVDTSFYPHATAETWTALPPSFAAGVDAAVNWGDGRVFFFKGNKYVRYDVESDTVDRAIYPRDISDGWPDFPASFVGGVDAVVNWGNGSAYFFKGGSYLNYDVENSKVRPGYPLPITEPGKWPELVSAGFAGPIDDVIEWPQADVLRASVPDKLVTGTKKVDPPKAQCGGSFEMSAVFADATPSIPACAEYRQYVRGSVLVDGVRLKYLTREHGVAQPVLMRPRPDPGSLDDNFVEDGQAASNVLNPFGVDLTYGHRDAAVGNRNLTDLYLPQRRSGAQYAGRDAPLWSGAQGFTVQLELDFRGQLIDVCNGGAVLRTQEWTVRSELP